jgi:hypothetical protein
MADAKKESDGPEPCSASAFDFTLLPDYNNDFINEDDFDEFARALAAPEHLSPSSEDLTAQQLEHTSRPSTTGVQSTNAYGGGRKARHPHDAARMRHARASYTYC